MGRGTDEVGEFVMFFSFYFEEVGLVAEREREGISEVYPFIWDSVIFDAR